MKTLVIDSATEACSVALLDGDRMSPGTGACSGAAMPNGWCR
jgi:tRNA A37 threonylcarbamoyladenosine modification protein TsaB